MNEFELRALYDRLVRARATGRRACVAPDALMRLAAGDASEIERLTWLEHVTSCAECREELALAQAVVEAGTALVGRNRRSATPWLALAASVVLVLGGVALWRSSLPEPADVSRGSGDRLTLVMPAGAVGREQASRLVWRAVPRAVRYDVEIVAAAGALVFSRAVAAPDTAVALSDVALTAGVEYRWRVTAQLDDGGRASSTALAFSLRGP